MSEGAPLVSSISASHRASVPVPFIKEDAGQEIAVTAASTEPPARALGAPAAAPLVPSTPTGKVPVPTPASSNDKVPAPAPPWTNGALSKSKKPDWQRY